MTENPALPHRHGENVRFFFFLYEKEIRVFLIATFLLGGFLFGKSSLDHWQVNRFERWPVVTATILDLESIQKPSLKPNRVGSELRFQAAIEVEFLYREKWTRAEAWIADVPLKELKRLERGRQVQLRVHPEKPGEALFRWQDQALTVPAS